MDSLWGVPRPRSLPYLYNPPEGLRNFRKTFGGNPASPIKQKLAALLIVDAATRKTFNTGMKRILAALLFLTLAAPAWAGSDSRGFVLWLLSFGRHDFVTLPLSASRRSSGPSSLYLSLFVCCLMAVSTLQSTGDVKW